MSDIKDIEEIKSNKKIWEEKEVSKVTGKFGERKKDFVLDSGISIDRVYSPENTEGLDYINDLGFPGEFPFTRGVQATMYRSRYWTMRQYAGFGTAQETNARFRYLLEQGQTGLSTAFDLPTQIGLDSDDPLSSGEVGKVGVAIDTIEDMEVLFDQIPLDKVSTSMTINASAVVLLAMYVAVAQKRNIDASLLSGTIQNDILKEYFARGTYIFPPKPSMRLITNIFSYASKYLPKFNTISISGYHIREAGSTASEEVAFTLCDAIEYVNAALEAGLNIDSFAPRLSFFFNVHNNFFEEIAKFRAARRIWARTMKDRYNAKNPKSMMLRFHSQTAGCSLTAQQPMNNIVRVTLQALSSVLGGTQSLHTNSFDEALALPTEESVMIALRTQQIIAHESGVADTIDPLAGSYFIENLTDSLEKKILEIMNEIDRMGGMLRAIEEGYVQKRIENSAYKYQQDIESNEKVIVGLNKFTKEEKLNLNLQKISEDVEINQIARLGNIKKSRDNIVVKKHLDIIRNTAKADNNLFIPILDAVKDYVSLGEIISTLKSEFGEFRESYS